MIQTTLLVSTSSNDRGGWRVLLTALQWHGTETSSTPTQGVGLAHHVAGACNVPSLGSTLSKEEGLSGRCFKSGGIRMKDYPGLGSQSQERS